MQAGIMPTRMLDSMPMMPLCRSPESEAAAGAAELLSQCTTEWSRYFIASRIAPCGKYTAALTADLSPQPSEPVYHKPGGHQLLTQSSLTLTVTTASPKFGLDDSTSSGSSSSLSSLSTSPTDSPGSDCTGGGGGHPDFSPTPLRKVASCADTAREKSRKRVQFADEVGQALTRVKFLCDPSVHLPSDSELHSNGSSEVALPGVSCTQQQQQQQDSDSCMQLKCKFSQPSTKYIVFREAVERNLVCLSLVHLDFSTIRGAIAVKNVSFNKRVFARFTFDSWRSFRDVEATYNGSEGQQDNFAFSVQCPSDQLADVEFCVCFQCDSGTFWDSNGGDNYSIAVSRWAAADDANCGYTRDFKPNYCSVSEFSEFSAWEHFTDRVYY